MDIFNTITGSTFASGDQPLNTLLNQLFYVGLAAAVVLAIVMIVRGGIEYMTIDSMDSKNSGKKRVEAALGGLLLAFSAILILNTINPNITKLDLAFSRLQGIGSITVGGVLQPGTPGSGSGTGSGSGSGAPIPAGSSEEQVRAYFANNGIAIKNGPCTNGRTSGCTNVAGLGNAAQIGVVNLKNASGAVITITGGTEDGHATHGVGKSIVDLRKNTTLNNWIIDNATSNYPRGSWTEYKHRNGTTFMNEGDHWHVQF